MSSEMADGLPQKEWNRILDKYACDGGMEPEEYEQMSQNQKFTIKELDKCFSRLGAKNLNLN